MFKTLLLKQTLSGKQKRKTLTKHKEWELALWLVDSYVSASNSDNLIVSLDRKRRKHMISESEENGNVLILPTPIPPLW